MPTAALSTRGRVVIPKAIREALGLRPGDRMDFVLQDSGDILVLPVVRDVRALKGCARSRRREPVSLDEMDRAVAGSQGPVSERRENP